MTTNIAPAGMTKKRSAAAKRDLALLAGVRMVEAEAIAIGCGLAMESRREALQALREWVAAEKAAGALP